MVARKHPPPPRGYMNVHMLRMGRQDLQIGKEDEASMTDRLWRTTACAQGSHTLLVTKCPHHG